MSRLIGLVGYAQTGKDTVADTTGFEKVAFADTLREVVKRLNPWVYNVRTDEFHTLNRYDFDKDYEMLKRDTDLRPFMVNVGAGLRALIDPDIWVNAGVEKIEEALGWSDVVVTDVRYSNEATAVLELEGELWRIHRAGILSANDEEERTIDDIDKRFHYARVIYNNGTIEELRTAVEGSL